MKNWVAYVLVAMGFVAYEAVTEADRDASGAIVGEGTVGAFDVRVGDCFDDSGSMSEIESLPAVPCSEPHDNEAYAVFDVALDEYPNEDAMWELANDKCLDRFNAFVGLDYESSSLDIFTMYPSTESWAQNDREVICAVYDMETNKLVGSVQGRGI